MPFFDIFDIFASPRWSPLCTRTKVVSFFIFFQELSNKQNISTTEEEHKLEPFGRIQNFSVCGAKANGHWPFHIKQKFVSNKEIDTLNNRMEGYVCISQINFRPSTELIWNTQIWNWCGQISMLKMWKISMLISSNHCGRYQYWLALYLVQ